MNFDTFWNDESYLIEGKSLNDIKKYIFHVNEKTFKDSKIEYNKPLKKEKNKNIFIDTVVFGQLVHQKQ